MSARANMHPSLPFCSEKNPKPNNYPVILCPLNFIWTKICTSMAIKMLSFIVCLGVFCCLFVCLLLGFVLALFFLKVKIPASFVASQKIMCKCGSLWCYQKQVLRFDWVMFYIFSFVSAWALVK